MNKHTAPAKKTAVQILATVPTTAKHATIKRTVWLSLMGASAVFYIGDLNHALILSFMWEHIEQIILVTGVSRVLGD